LLYQLNPQRSGYEAATQSLAVPQLPIQELPQFMERARAIAQQAAVLELAQRVLHALTDTEQ
jgi:hypothetical protein